MKQLTLIKGKHLHVIAYDVGEEPAVLDAVIAMVNNCDLEFDWYDAAILSHQVGVDLAKERKASTVKK